MAGGLFPNASYGSLGEIGDRQPGSIYGNAFVVPLIGGSGGGGTIRDNIGIPNLFGGGGGGGGGILIAAPDIIEIRGRILAKGGNGAYDFNYPAGGGAGSGGAVRLIAQRISGTGILDVSGGLTGRSDYPSHGGSGRIRIDAYENIFGGNIAGVWTQGFQPIIIPTPGQGAQLNILSVGGMTLPGNPSSNPANPAAVIPAQQFNPVSIVVGCANLPLNTPITVTVKPVNGSPVSASGYNSTGTLASSTATISMTMPRGGGIIYATAAN